MTQRQQVREQNVSSQEGDEGDATSDRDEIINEIFARKVAMLMTV